MRPQPAIFGVMKFAPFVLSLLCLCFWYRLEAQTAARVIELPLWPEGRQPGGRSNELNETWTERPISDGTAVARDRSVKDISRPTMTVYLPAVPNPARTSVVIFPGGGFSHLAIDKEGHDIARWLNEKGIAGIVVKYRVYHEENQYYVSQAALPDAFRAIRLVRNNASKWNLNPNRIGAMGFSAGGYLAAAAGTLFESNFGGLDDAIQALRCRPDFIVPIYPLTELEERVATNSQFAARVFGPNVKSTRIEAFSPISHVSPESPPAFLVHAHDDGLSPVNSVKFYLALLEAGVPAELHVYSMGGHGFGMRQRGLPVSSWGDRFFEWLVANGLYELEER